MKKDNRLYICQPLCHLNLLFFFFFSERLQCHKRMQGLLAVVTLEQYGCLGSKLLITAMLEFFRITGKFRTSGGHLVQLPPQVPSVMKKQKNKTGWVTQSFIKFSCTSIKYSAYKLKGESNLIKRSNSHKQTKQQQNQQIMLKIKIIVFLYHK